MDDNKQSLGFRFLKSLVRLFYPNTEIIGCENLSDESCIIVGNHAQMHGPLVSELFFPDSCHTWCAAEMMQLKEVPAYAYKDFWSQKPVYIKWFYKLLSYIIAPLCIFIFNNARTIGVYRDVRLRNTFRESIEKLESGSSVVIFPEHASPHNNIVYDFQDGFIDVARMYYKRRGKAVSFVPMYIAPALKKAYLGKAIRFDPNAPIDQERKRICNYLMTQITDIARSLPEHTVVPYMNISKKLYPSNISAEVTANENTGS